MVGPHWAPGVSLACLGLLLGPQDKGGRQVVGHSWRHSVKKNQSLLPTSTVWGPGKKRVPALKELCEPDCEAGAAPAAQRGCPPPRGCAAVAGSGLSACSSPRLPSRP